MFFKHLKKNKNKGFTLVELIVTFALFAIIGIGAMVLLIETSNIFHSTTRLNNVQNAVLVLTDTIKANMYGTEEAEFLDEMPSESDRGSIIWAGGQPEDFGYLYFNPDTGILEKAVGGQPALGISMAGVSGLAQSRYTFDVYFSNNDDDVVIIDVYVLDGTDLIYNYSTSVYLHNLKDAADIAAAATAQKTTADPEAPVTTAPPTTDVGGHIGGVDQGGYKGGLCLKYKIPD